MILLLTILSWLLVWAVIVVLSIGLLRVRHALERVRDSLQQIAMGVRAIEHQTAPLGSYARDCRASMRSAGESVSTLGSAMTAVGHSLETAAPALRRQR
jgi:uncharacterized protein YoxC